MVMYLRILNQKMGILIIKKKKIREALNLKKELKEKGIGGIINNEKV